MIVNHNVDLQRSTISDDPCHGSRRSRRSRSYLMPVGHDAAPSSSLGHSSSSEDSEDKNRHGRGRNDALQIFCYHMKGQSLCYSDTNSGWWVTPLPSEICIQSDPPPPFKRADFDRFSLVTSQP